MEDRNYKDKLKEERAKLVLQRQAEINREKKHILPANFGDKSAKVAKKAWRAIEKS